MNKKSCIAKIYKKMISSIKKEKNTNKLYGKIKCCAKFLYEINQFYVEETLESKILDIAKNYEEVQCAKHKKIMFIDSFGFSYRGLVNQYIDGLIANDFDFVYVCYNKEPNSLTQKILNKGREVILCEDSIVSISLLINALRTCSDMILYITPWDINALICASLFRGNRMIINLNDHAFWLGTKFIDYCIEFRNYGANISYYKRKISKEKLIYLPFYPTKISKEFHGYPCAKMNKENTIFSGGSIYKTIDKKLTYYNLIDNILSKNNNVFFWYAGSGKTKYLKKLKSKYKGRVFITSERDDLLKVLENSKIYISTYPINGGLMTQYCALANIPALTLLLDESCGGILLNQGKDVFEYEDPTEFLEEINQLLSDEDYYRKRLTNWSNTIISEETFDKGLKDILLKQKTIFNLDLTCELNTDKFLNTYLERTSLLSIISKILDRKGSFIRTFWFLLPIIVFGKIIQKIK